MYDSQNIFAKIINREIPATIVLENDIALAFKDINPQADIHILIVPKMPAIDFEDFLKQPDENINAFFRFIQEVAKSLGVTEYRLVSNKGPASGQTIFHFHVHLLSGNCSPTF